MHKVLPEFDLFLISSDTEGLPLSVLEAFACKIPVVATAAGGTGEAVKNRETGMLSPVKDAAKLAENALEVINDPSLKELLIESAYHMVSTYFTLDVMQREYYSFYKNLKEIREQKI
ncbi:glycosyltransferase family 4 protein [Antarcticibacterium sp. 1MA-6-2]|uniref:glycosyltransferase family 4 protein n=1 Tax=Antarcticibacterium sp. 1MA-6-2 TaxID=2908210 RepID=UPI002107C9C9|nr:glycosyltransferase family 4 protein [Antarcticibacterium sp. 1MA-6-2]